MTKYYRLVYVTKLAECDVIGSVIEEGKPIGSCKDIPILNFIKRDLNIVRVSNTKSKKLFLLKQ